MGGAALVTVALAKPRTGKAQSPGRLATFERSTLKIHSGGKVHDFRIEVASNARQHAQGLMFRRRLAKDAGMLFVYRRAEVVNMWMRNTFIPLDMLFIGTDGRIVSIAERTVPMSEKIVSSGEPAIGVLEVNAGTASRLKLKAGDRIESPAFAGGS